MSNDRCNKSIHCTVEQCAKPLSDRFLLCAGQHYRRHT